MNTNAKFKLLKPNQPFDSLSNEDTQTFQIKVIKSMGKPYEQRKMENQYLNCFYQLYSAVFDEYEYEDVSDNTLCLLLISLYEMFKLRIQLSYENEIIKSDGIPYKDILKSNKEFLEKIKSEILEYKKRIHLSYLDEVYILEIESLIADYNSNVINGCIFKSRFLDMLDDMKKCNSDSLFHMLVNYEIDLGTKLPSKGKKRNINYILITTYYDILCDYILRQEFIDVLDNKKDIDNCNERIKTLFKKVNYDSLVKFRKYVEKRDIALESFLLMYIVNEMIYLFAIEDIKKFYNEDELENISYMAMDSVDDGIDGMYLNMKYDIDHLNCS